MGQVGAADSAMPIRCGYHRNRIFATRLVQDGANSNLINAVPNCGRTYHDTEKLQKPYICCYRCPRFGPFIRLLQLWDCCQITPTSLYSMTGEMQTKWHWKSMSPLLTLRRDVPAPIRLRRVGPAPNCPDAELAAPSCPRPTGSTRNRVSVHLHQAPSDAAVTGVWISCFLGGGWGRDQSGRLSQEHRVGPVGGQVAEDDRLLPVLLGAVRRHQVQHHHPPQDALLRRQSHHALHRHLLGNTRHVVPGCLIPVLTVLCVAVL